MVRCSDHATVLDMLYAYYSEVCTIYVSTDLPLQESTGSTKLRSTLLLKILSQAGMGGGNICKYAWFRCGKDCLHI